MTGAASSYEGDAGRALTARYEAVYPDELHKGVTPHFPAAPAAVLDIGAGSGRDAAWLAEQGYTVLAVEPSETMRMEGARLHPDARITWLSADNLGSDPLGFWWSSGKELLELLVGYLGEHAVAHEITRHQVERPAPIELS